MGEMRLWTYSLPTAFAAGTISSLMSGLSLGASQKTGIPPTDLEQTIINMSPYLTIGGGTLTGLVFMGLGCTFSNPTEKQVSKCISIVGTVSLTASSVVHGIALGAGYGLGYYLS